MWVANADVAAVAIVFACTRPGLRGQGVTAFLMPMDAPGITRAARADSLGVRGLGCMDLDLDVEVGDGQVLGSVDQGFRVAMWALQGGRIAIAAQALGIGMAALGEAIRFAKARHAFGYPIATFEAIQWMIADIGDRSRSGAHVDLEGRVAQGTAGARHARSLDGEACRIRSGAQAADKAMQILASEGYRRGSVVERLFRDARATEIYQGTSEAQRMIIAARCLT